MYETSHDTPWTSETVSFLTYLADCHRRLDEEVNPACQGLDDERQILVKDESGLSMDILTPEYGIILAFPCRAVTLSLSGSGVPLHRSEPAQRARLLPTRGISWRSDPVAAARSV